MVGPIIVLVCDILAMAYLATLAYRVCSCKVRTGEIKFYPGVGPVIIPIPIANTKRGGNEWSSGNQLSAQKTKDT